MSDQPPEMITAIWRRFEETGEWPTVQRIASDLPDRDVRLVAREVGRDLIDCQWGSGGRCRLELRGIAMCAGATQLIADFVDAVRFLSEQYIEAQMPVVPGAAIAEALELDNARYTRLAQVLWSTHNGMSVSGNIGELKYDIALTPSIVAFREITDLEDFFTELDRARSEEDEAARHEHGARTAVIPNPITQDANLLENPPQLSDPALSRMLHEDLEELLRIKSARAWKATVLLAGSCIEAALLDLWMSRPDEAKEALGEKWHRSSAYDMAKAAVEKGWIDEDHKPLLDFVRQWRNTIHPARALEKHSPSRELAHMLIASLDYLLVVLRRADPTLYDDE